MAVAVVVVVPVPVAVVRTGVTLTGTTVAGGRGRSGCAAGRRGVHHPVPGFPGIDGGVAEAPAHLQADVAVEDAAQHPDRVGLVRLGQVVPAQERPRHLGVPDARAGGRGLRVEPEPGGVVPARVFPGVVAVRVGERGQRVLARAARQRGGDPVREFRESEQRDPGLEVLRTLHVRVQARDLDVEPPGECRDGHLVEADLVGQLRTRPGQPLSRQPCAHHKLPPVFRYPSCAYLRPLGKHLSLAGGDGRARRSVRGCPRSAGGRRPGRREGPRAGSTSRVCGEPARDEERGRAARRFAGPGGRARGAGRATR